MSEMKVRSIVGCTRTIRTAVMVCEFLREHLAYPHSDVHPDRIHYEFKDPKPANGYWSADIYIDGDLDSTESSRFVLTCRAFAAGAGEVW